MGGQEILGCEGSIISGEGVVGTSIHMIPSCRTR